MKNRKLLMIPGPTPVVRSIQDQMGRETAAFGDPAFVADFKSVITDLKELFGSSGEVFVVAGTGTMAMEMALANSLTFGDELLVVSHGFFGDRFIELAKRKGIKVDVLSYDWGKAPKAEEIQARLAKKAYKAVTVTHVDTSTGVVAPIEEIGRMLEKFPDTLYIVDGVAATGGERVAVDEYNIDILFTGSQKAFGVSPGLALLWVGAKAMDRAKSLEPIPEYYISFEKWLPIMHDTSKYFATPAINMIWALKEALTIMKNEGMENRYVRHEKNARAMQAAYGAMGFKLLAEEGARAVTLSCCLYPEGIDDASFRSALAEEGAMVAGGLSAYAGKLFRMGHMGNTDQHELIGAVAAMERALYQGGLNVLGKGLTAIQQELTRE